MGWSAVQRLRTLLRRTLESWKRNLINTLRRLIPNNVLDVNFGSLELQVATI
jgi:hypothetical protein